jgi:hypothetical protein
MLAQALLGVEKTDRLDTVRLYGLHLAVVGPTAGLLASPRSCEGAESMAPFPAASSTKLSLEAESMLPFFRRRTRR